MHRKTRASGYSSRASRFCLSVTRQPKEISWQNFVEFNLSEFGKTFWGLVIFRLPLQFDVGPSFQKTLISVLMSGTISVKLWVELHWFGNQTHTKLGV